jgi:anti-anti-sigma factor
MPLSGRGGKTKRPGPMDHAVADYAHKLSSSIERGTKAMRLTCTIDAEAEQIIIVAQGQHDRRKAASLELSHRILPTGETVARIGGELDIATADTAVRYVTQVIDHRDGPVIVDLTALRFCDARGLSALLRIALYAEQRDHKFRVASPRPSLVKLLRITALDRKLLGTTGPGGAATTFATNGPAP